MCMHACTCMYVNMQTVTIICSYSSLFIGNAQKCIIKIKKYFPYSCIHSYVEVSLQAIRMQRMNVKVMCIYVYIHIYETYLHCNQHKMLSPKASELQHALYTYYIHIYLQVHSCACVCLLFTKEMCWKIFLKKTFICKYMYLYM